MPLYTLATARELEKVLKEGKRIKLYGAGFYLNLFLQGLEELDSRYLERIDFIMVSDTNENMKQIKGIPVISYKDAIKKMGGGDYVLLTLGHRYTYDIYELLKNTGVYIFQVNFNMFQEKAYQEVKESIWPFLEHFPSDITGLNEPVWMKGGIRAWTCWWQGVDAAPDIVRVCWDSQKKNLPLGTEHIIITENNYKDYITLPEYVIAKVKSKDISLATLSDIIRAILLYKYGGFWMDATLLVLNPLPKDILNYSIYTRSLPETQFCADAMWAGWFLYAKPGNKLFCFLYESFFYYFKTHDRIKHYFMIDYIIAIASNTFLEVEEQLKKIPYNNERATELAKHLLEIFDEKKYKNYIRGTFVQKLTYKVDSTGMKNTVYKYLLEMEG